MNESPASSEFLKACGLSIVQHDSASLIFSECARIVEGIFESEKASIGLLPVNAEVPIPPLALQLAAAMTAIRSQKVAILDANIYRPFSTALGERGTLGDDPEALFSTIWLTETVALIRPEFLGPTETTLNFIAQALEGTLRRFSRILVDLSGFMDMDNLAETTTLIEGLILVARSRSTTESQLLELKQRIEASRLLGVILVG
jgi:hypothetical protein